MKIMRMTLCLLSLFGFASFVTAQTVEKSRVSVTTTERIPFTNGVSVHLKDTFGEVRVEGWERDEIEIELTRGTQKKYAASEHAKEKRRLEKVKLAITNDNAGGLLIETKNMPFMKNNFSLEYKVKVPQSIYLKVKHGIGEVTIKNMTSDIEATVRIGELAVEMPETVPFDLDARAKIGEVASDFAGQYNRPKVLGAKLVGETKHSEPHKLYLRVGIGEVQVKRMEAVK
ncbi:MAG TPA: hypothetical protein VFZ34_05555 [Blastocatellia bacterium]|nr:hypothetical protein [Blastocatellia bacterium]